MGQDTIATTTGGTTGQVTFTPEQQEFINKLIGEARIKSRETARAEYEQELAKKKDEADLKALEADKKWQELATQHQSRILELEPLESKIGKYQVVIDKMLADKVKALGEVAKTAIEALPGDLDSLEKLSWLDANEKLFAVTNQRERGTQPGGGSRNSGNQAVGGSGCPIKL